VAFQVWRTSAVSPGQCAQQGEHAYGVQLTGNGNNAVGSNDVPCGGTSAEWLDGPAGTYCYAVFQIDDVGGQKVFSPNSNGKEFTVP
jgi:hypothetical protein